MGTKSKDVKTMETSEIVKEFARRVKGGSHPESLYAFIEAVINARINRELEEITTVIRETEIDSHDNSIVAASRRGTDAVVEATIALMRQTIAQVVNSRVQLSYYN